MNICTKFQVDIFKKWLRYSIKNMSKTGTFHVIFGTFTVIFPNCVFYRIWRFKKCFRVFFSRSLRKSDLKKCIEALNHEIFCFTFFHLVTWDDLDLYYGHKAQEMLLTDVSDTIHADSLALFALNIEILLADVTKPEKVRKLWTLTWPVDVHQWPLDQIFDLVRIVHVQGYRMAFEIWKISPVSFGRSQGGPLPPPPAGRVYYPGPPAGRGFKRYPSCWVFV